jgi:hypothetical protein
MSTASVDTRPAAVASSAGADDHAADDDAPDAAIADVTSAGSKSKKKKRSKAKSKTAVGAGAGPAAAKTETSAKSQLDAKRSAGTGPDAKPAEDGKSASEFVFRCSFQNYAISATEKCFPLCFEPIKHLIEFHARTVVGVKHRAAPLLGCKCAACPASSRLLLFRAHP